ncbi:hypothetical protein GCM10027075_32710 [Streptomyces heilongjiangensis]
MRYRPEVMLSGSTGSGAGPGNRNGRHGAGARPGPDRIRRAVRAPPPGEPLRGAARENRSFAQVASPSASGGVRSADKSRAGPARTAMWVVHAVLPWQTEWPCRTSGRRFAPILYRK